MSNISEKVTAIIVDKLGVDASEVTPDASFTNDLGTDSLDTVELVWNSRKNSISLFQTTKLKTSALLVRLLSTSKTRLINSRLVTN